MANARDRRILWTKFMDPLAHMVYEKPDWMDEEDWQQEQDINARAAKDSFYDEDDDGPTPYFHGQRPSGYNGPAFYGPFGPVPLTESTLPSKIFNFWVGHTNFDLTHKSERLIEKVEGVETLQIWTRYRFWVGIGKAFKQDEVKKGIEKALLSSSHDKLASLKAKLAAKHKYWAVCHMPGDKYEMFGGQTEDEVLEKCQPFSKKAKRTDFSWK